MPSIRPPNPLALSWMGQRPEAEGCRHQSFESSGPRRPHRVRWWSAWKLAMATQRGSTEPANADSDPRFSPDSATRLVGPAGPCTQADVGRFWAGSRSASSNGPNGTSSLAAGLSIGLCLLEHLARWRLFGGAVPVRTRRTLPTRNAGSRGRTRRARPPRWRLARRVARLPWPPDLATAESLQDYWADHLAEPQPAAELDAGHAASTQRRSRHRNRLRPRRALATEL